jgi:Predicted hydrolases of HD superfamily
VKRYHAWPTTTQQTVAHHSWRVATLLVEIFGMPRAEVLYFALWHDGGELFAGDVPYQVKVSVPGMSEMMDAAERRGLEMLGIQLPELIPMERAQVKIADIMEMHEFGQMEVTMGNQYGKPVMYDTVAHARRIAKEHGLDLALNAWISRSGVHKDGRE